MTIERMQALAAARGGEFLSTVYTNGREKYDWRCGLGHEWRQSPKVIVGKAKWCAECARSAPSLGERISRRILELMFGVELPTKRPEWLVFPPTGGVMELDGFSEEDNLAFEYQGLQHYEVVPGLKFTPERVEDQRRRDAFKLSACFERGVRLIVVPAFSNPEKLDSCIDQIEFAVLCAGLKIRRNWKRPKEIPEIWRPLPSMFGANKLDALRSAAKERGGELLSEAALRSKTHLLWRCQNNHEWLAPAQRILSGSWCRFCAWQKRSGAKPKFTPPDFVMVDGVKTWHCPLGHSSIFEPKPSRREDWCPQCRYDRAAVKLRAQQRMEQKAMGRDLLGLQKLASEREGECLAEEFLGSERPLLWRCSEGHEWMAKPKNVWGGTWCRPCTFKKNRYGTNLGGFGLRKCAAVTAI